MPPDRHTATLLHCHTAGLPNSQSAGIANSENDKTWIAPWMSTNEWFLNLVHSLTKMLET